MRSGYVTLNAICILNAHTALIAPQGYDTIGCPDPAALACSSLNFRPCFKFFKHDPSCPDDTAACSAA